MSDNIKLIIEIPKEIYERCKEYKLWSYDAETHEGAVAQGTPLANDSERAETQASFAGEAYGWEQGRKALIEEVKAEIEKLNPVDYGSMFSYESHNGAKDMQIDVLQILDNIGKAESEGI